MILHQNKELFVNYYKDYCTANENPRNLCRKRLLGYVCFVYYRIVESRKIFLSPWHYENSKSGEKRNLVYIYLIGLNLIKSKNGNS